MVEKSQAIELTASIVSAFVGNDANRVAQSELPDLISATLSALITLGDSEAVVTDRVSKPTPAQIRKSITHDALISFEDGKPYKTLKRHLTTHGMTVAEYKAKWGLPNDYPTTAPAYSEARSAMAKALGLGQGGRKVKAAAPPAKVTKAKAKA
jgi:predicted transcriptional regulator